MVVTKIYTSQKVEDINIKINKQRYNLKQNKKLTFIIKYNKQTTSIKKYNFSIQMYFYIHDKPRSSPFKCSIHDYSDLQHTLIKGVTFSAG